MTLPEELWQALQLSPEVIADRARFYNAYAELGEPRPNIRDLIRLTAPGQQAAGGEPVVDLLNHDDSEAQSVLESIEALGPGEQLAPWARTGELASAFLERAVAELMVDTARGRETLLQAASLYQQLGLPFGPFLITAVTGSPELAVEAGRRLAVVIAGEPLYFLLPDEGLIGWQQASRAATQQVSLLLTAVSHRAVVAENPQVIDDWGDAPQASGITPVGTTSQPIALWWAAGLQASRPSPGAS